MKKILAVLSVAIASLTSSPVRAESVTLAWDPNPHPETFGYYLYWGTESGIYSERSIISADYSEDTVTGLQRGVTYYFAISAFILEDCFPEDERGHFTPTLCYLEGTLSDEISYTVPTREPELRVLPEGIYWRPDLRNFDEFVVTSDDYENWQLLPAQWFVPATDGWFFLTSDWYRNRSVYAFRFFKVIRTPRQ